MKLILQKLKRLTPHSLAFCAALLAGCQQQAPKLEHIQNDGHLIVGTLEGPTTFYSLGNETFGGFDYTLMTRYADQQGFEVIWRTYASADALLDDLARGRIDIAAPGLPVSDAQNANVYLAPAYQDAVPVVVQRVNSDTPAGESALEGQSVMVAAATLLADKVTSLEKHWPNVHWTVQARTSATELLAQVRDGKIDRVVVSEPVFNRLRTVFPELKVALTLGSPEPIAWALRRDGDMSLLASLSRFFEGEKRSGLLAKLAGHYFAEEAFDEVDARIFLDHIDTRLPRFEKAFRRAGQDNQVDWRLLAAIGYQESLWDPGAVSPTGMAGVMMLAPGTAKEVGVKNRRNGNDNIRGGSRYFRSVISQLPESIHEADRLWFALAGYNMGLGHIFDARRLTQTQGGDPDRWLDVEARLPLLEKPEYYRNARHGCGCTARQAVAYVRNVRYYYDALVWNGDMGEHRVLTAQREQRLPAPL